MPRWRTFGLGFGLWLLVSPETFAQGQSDRGWIFERNSETGESVMTMQMKVHPKPEAKPALKYQLIPEYFERQEGNSAVYYLRAMGFLEHDAAREKLLEIQRKSREKSREEDRPVSDFPPHNWLSMTPAELPKQEVKQYMQLLSMQPRDLERARNMRIFSMERNLHNEDNPWLVLLPEIQVMRELARNQSTRCRLAIAEENFEEAFNILGQQFALANHLSQDPFLVSNLVGTAIVGIALTDFLHLVQMPNAENMYWALAALPDPVVDVTQSLSVERHFLFLQVKSLLDVTEDVKQPGYWAEFIDRHLKEIEILGVELMIPQISDRDLQRTAFVTAIGAAYPGAKSYLINELGMDQELVERYPIAQTVFLAERRFFEHSRDEFHKWFHVSPNHVLTPEMRAKIDSDFREHADRIGLAALPSVATLPAVTAAVAATQRTEMQIAMLQTVEAIRIFGAQSGGKLPASLKELTVPIPRDPISGGPVEYHLDGNQATLFGRSSPIVYKLVLSFE